MSVTMANEQKEMGMNVSMPLKHNVHIFPENSRSWIFFVQFS